MAFDVRQPKGIVCPIAPYSSVVVSGDLVVISGQVPFDEAGKLISEEFDEQAHRVFQNLALCLQAADCDFEDVIKINAYLSNPDDFATYNGIYVEYFSPPYPARTTVLAGLLSGFRIEVDALARCEMPPS